MNKTTSTQFRFHFLLLLVCFWLSGLGAIIYETAWSEEFVLIFGGSEMATATVLAAYMAGLALGAAMAAKYGSNIQKPLFAYAVLELLIAISALGVPYAIALTGWLQLQLFGGETLASGFQVELLIFDFMASFLILMIPTTFMGATLPLLAKHVVRENDQIGPRIGWLYMTNTLGAACGAAFSVFLLLPNMGLNQTVWIGVSINVLVFLIACLLPRLDKGAHNAVDEPPQTTTAPRFHWVLPLILITGMVSFILEILWTRLLSHIMGGSIYAFGTMLSVYLLGIAIGAAVGARLARTVAKAHLGFAISQLGMAGGALLSIYCIDWIPSMANQQPGFKSIMDLQWFAASLVILPCALFSGSCFPFAVRIIAKHAAESGTVSGRVFAWNTVGAIVGAVLGGFILIPQLEFAHTVRFTASLNCLAAIWAATRLLPSAGKSLRVRGLQVGSLIALVICLLTPIPMPWQVLRSSALATKPNDGEVVFLGVGRSGTVMVTEEQQNWRLSTNGLPESIIVRKGGKDSNLRVAKWLSMLSLVAKPDVETMMVIGLGAGLTVDRLPSHIKSIHVVELEPEVVAANALLAEKRQHDPLSDPRLSITYNDARSALALTRQKFDAIISQPSHPWTSAASHLFTHEFFKTINNSLTDEGVFVQWIGVEFVNGPLLQSLIATLNGVFEYVEVYAPRGKASILFLAADKPLYDDQKVDTTLIKAEEQWHRIGVFRAEDIFSTRLLSARESRDFGRGEAKIYDRHNLFKTRSPLVMGHAMSVAEFERLFSNASSFWADIPQDMDRLYMVRRLLEVGFTNRAKQVAQNTADLATKQTATGLIHLVENRLQAGVQLLTRQLRLNPQNHEAAAALLRMNNVRLRNGDVPFQLPGLLEGVAFHILEGWQMAHNQDWQSLSELDDKLSIDDPSHPLFSYACELRIKWRCFIGDQKALSEALALYQDYQVESRKPVEDLLGVHLGIRTGDTDFLQIRAKSLSLWLVNRRQQFPQIYTYCVREIEMLHAKYPNQPILDALVSQVRN